MLPLLVVALLSATPVVELVHVEGIIDAPTERAVLSTLRQAEREGAQALVIEVDSTRQIGRRVERIRAAIEDSSVPVVTWVGPPGARAHGDAELLVTAGDVASMAPGASLTLGGRGPVSAQQAKDAGTIDIIALSIPDLLAKLDGFDVGGGDVLRTDGAIVRLHKLDMLGRVQHGAAKPSIAYLLLLLGLVGLVFETFHPSRGPAGIAGLVSLGLAGYGIATLGGSWVAAVLVVLGVLGFCVDLRFQSLGLFTALGLAGLIAGSIMLFPSPTLRPSPWVLGFGVVSMVAFLLGAMTRVLRDLRAMASEVHADE